MLGDYHKKNGKSKLLLLFGGNGEHLIPIYA